MATDACELRSLDLEQCGLDWELKNAAVRLTVRSSKPEVEICALAGYFDTTFEEEERCDRVVSSELLVSKTARMPLELAKEAFTRCLGTRCNGVSCGCRRQWQRSIPWSDALSLGRVSTHEFSGALMRFCLAC